MDSERVKGKIRKWRVLVSGWLYGLGLELWGFLGEDFEG